VSRQQCSTAGVATGVSAFTDFISATQAGCGLPFTPAPNACSAQPVVPQPESPIIVIPKAQSNFIGFLHLLSEGSPSAACAMIDESSGNPVAAEVKVTVRPVCVRGNAIPTV